MRDLIAFDLDGVIYSSETFLGEAYREAIAKVNAARPGSFPRVPSTHEILAHVGWPVPVILERLFPGVDKEAVELLYAEALPVIGDYVARKRGMVFPGVADTLARLHSAQHQLAIASNGRSHYVATVLETYDLARYFVEVICVDRDRRPQKADLLRSYAALYDVSFARMVMIGDRSSDVEAAQTVGCRFIGCDYGHGHRDEIEGAGPIVDAFTKIPDLIESMTN